MRKSASAAVAVSCLGLGLLLSSAAAVAADPATRPAHRAHHHPHPHPGSGGGVIDTALNASLGPQTLTAAVNTASTVPLSVHTGGSLLNAGVQAGNCDPVDRQLTGLCVSAGPGTPVSPN